jgi:hypothetical protein
MQPQALFVSFGPLFVKYFYRPLVQHNNILETDRVVQMRYIMLSSDGVIHT